MNINRNDLDSIADYLRPHIKEFSSGNAKEKYQPSTKNYPSFYTWQYDPSPQSSYDFFFSILDDDNKEGVQFDFGATLKSSPSKYFLGHTYEGWQYERLNEAINDFLEIIKLAFTHKTRIRNYYGLCTENFKLEVKEATKWREIAGNRANVTLPFFWKREKIFT